MRSAPEIMRRRWIAQSLIAAPSIIFIGIGAAKNPMIMAVVMIGSITIISILPFLFERSYRMQLRQHKYKVCFHCGQPLINHHDRLLCTECGSKKTIKEVRGDWKNLYKVPPSWWMQKR